uniref:Uncharacterized protein n=1 Tax=Nothobranchius furzeri TaxID=105023 RepID=A0A8C6KYK6_NOTFU
MTSFMDSALWAFYEQGGRSGNGSNNPAAFCGRPLLYSQNRSTKTKSFVCDHHPRSQSHIQGRIKAFGDQGKYHHLTPCSDGPIRWQRAESADCCCFYLINNHFKPETILVLLTLFMWTVRDYFDLRDAEL